MAVVVAIQGPSGSGKTTLIERLIPRLTAHGLQVGVIKHAHDGVQLDGQGKDSWRMWQAGAHTVLVASPHEVFARERRPWSTPRELVDLLPPHLDCVLLEGFTHALAAGAVPASVTVEMTPGGVRLNGQLLCCDDVASAVEAAVMSLRTATLITVNVLVFAQLRDHLGADALRVSLPRGSTGAEVFGWMSRRAPQVAGLLDVSRLAVNGEYVSRDHGLHDGDDVAVIPPVSGG